jgi:hypothetical protein
MIELPDRPGSPKLPGLVEDCRGCGVRHDPELHTAVLRVHSWFRQTVLGLEPPTRSAPPSPKITRKGKGAAIPAIASRLRC